MLKTGQVLNKRYKIISILSQGGFGAVYHAITSHLNMRCAAREILQKIDKLSSLFKQETKMLVKLCHPNLPRVKSRTKMRRKP